MPKLKIEIFDPEGHQRNFKILINNQSFHAFRRCNLFEVIRKQLNLRRNDKWIKVSYGDDPNCEINIGDDSIRFLNPKDQTYIYLLDPIGFY